MGDEPDDHRQTYEMFPESVNIEEMYGMVPIKNLGNY